MGRTGDGGVEEQDRRQSGRERGKVDSAAVVGEDATTAGMDERAGLRAEAAHLSEWGTVDHVR